MSFKKGILNVLNTFMYASTGTFRQTLLAALLFEIYITDSKRRLHFLFLSLYECILEKPKEFRKTS